MAYSDVLRPGSALATEPDLATALEGRLPSLEAAAATGGRGAREALADARDTWSLLAALPWQRLNYRWGRWQATQTAWKALISLEMWESYHWAPNDETFQVLDPHTGQRLGEFYTQARLRRFTREAYGRPDLIAQPGGTLEFVGNPASIGAFRPPGGNADTIRFSWNPWLNNETLREGIAGLRDGTADRMPPPYLPVDLDLLDEYRVWFTSEPNKPTRKAPFASKAANYRADTRPLWFLRKR